MSSPSAGSFSSLSSYASSAPDRQGKHVGGLPLPATAQTSTTRTTLLVPPSSANAINIPIDNSNPSNNINNTPNLLDPRTATMSFNLLPDLETGLDINRLRRLCQEQQSMPTSGTPEEEQELELGWKDAYEALIKAPLQSLAALARRLRMVRAEREEGMV